MPSPTLSADTQPEPTHVAPRRRVSRLLPVALAVLLGAGGIAASSAASATAATAVTGSSFEVALAGGTSVTTDNWSNYAMGDVSSLVQQADRSMATTNPRKNVVSGEMERGDQVVVTNYGIYWLDAKRRGGLLTGMWALTNDASGRPKFAYVANTNGWSPNWFAPGSDATTSRIYDTGQSLNVLPTGAQDGSCTAGHGTFVLQNSANCNLPLPPAAVTLVKSSNGSDHTYSYTGTLYQEGNGATTMVDGSGKSATVSATVTYHFRDYSDTTIDYTTASLGNAQQRVRTEVMLTPSAPIDLGTLVVAGVSDYAGTKYTPRKYSVANKDRNKYTDSAYTNCPAATVAALTVGSLCFGTQYGLNYLTTSQALPSTLAAADYVTQRQTSGGSTTERQTTYVVPEGTWTKPERIDHIWNTGLGVGTLDADFFNNESVPVTTTGLSLALDIQMTPR